ncbi:hypothetical protein NQ314_018732, partial [Rhamnusium bicolor]
AWLRVDWTDQHLTWNPDDYGSLNSIILETYEIWTPDLSVYNRAVQGGDPSIIGDTKCSISNEGKVQCVPSVHIDALCVPNLSMYPFDTQKCSLRMGSWIHKAEELDIDLIHNAVYTKTLEPNGEWEIVYNTQKMFKGRVNNITYTSIEFIFHIKRLAGAHAASVIVPTIVAVMLTFTSLSMSPLNNERIILCYVNLMFQFMHIQYMSWQVPLKGAQIPLLLLYARDSLLLSAFALIFTIIFKNIMTRESPTPGWISSIVSIAVRCVPGQFIFLSDYSVWGVASAKGEEDGTGIVDSERTKTEDWKIFGRILNVMLIIAYIIAYFVITLKFVP